VLASGGENEQRAIEDDLAELRRTNGSCFGRTTKSSLRPSTTPLASAGQMAEGL